MSEFKKPTSLNSLWASMGDKVKPSDEKLSIGWLVEIPHREHFNWQWNKTDSALAHINQHGVFVWDNLTWYLEGKSYVQGRDGLVYRCLLDHRGFDPVDNPSHWKVAFLYPEVPESDKYVFGYIPFSSDINATINQKYYGVAPASITLPDGVDAGDAVSVMRSPTASITVKFGGGIVTWMGEYQEVELDVYDEIIFVYDGSVWEVI